MPVPADSRSAPADLPPLTPEQQAKAELARDFVAKHMPDALPFIKELVKEGMLPGWRGIVSFRLLDR